MRVRITKEFDFEAAHALDGYAGKCQDIHGHNYHLTLTFLGEPINDKSLSINGMVVDFGDIKDFLNKKIKPLFIWNTICIRSPKTPFTYHACFISI